MSKEELHAHAQDTTPAYVQVPQTWGGLIVWAVGKWGAGAIFCLMLIWVYQDLQTANRGMVRVVESNARAIYQMAEEIKETNRRLEELRYRQPSNP